MLKMTASTEGYLLPPPEVAQNHVCVLPCGGVLKNVKHEWSLSDLKFYSSYIVNGQPIDRMFNGFVFKGLSVQEGRYLHPMYVGFGESGNSTDWLKWIDLLFSPEKNIKALYALATHARLDIWISIPYPYLNQKNFGMVNGKVLNFESVDDRFTAVSWWIDQFIERWQKEPILSERLNFQGFLWQREGILDYDEQLVKLTNTYIKKKGLHSMWLPFYGSSGCMKSQELGFDIVSLHPNFFGNTTFNSDWINHSAAFAKYYNTGLQIVYGKGSIFNNTHLYHYLAKGLPEHNNYMDQAFLVYQFPNQTLEGIYNEHLGDYIRLYTYIKGIYSSTLYPDI